MWVSDIKVTGSLDFLACSNHTLLSLTLPFEASGSLTNDGKESRGHNAHIYDVVQPTACPHLIFIPICDYYCTNITPAFLELLLCTSKNGTFSCSFSMISSPEGFLGCRSINRLAEGLKWAEASDQQKQYLKQVPDKIGGLISSFPSFYLVD